jgi:LacI family transcriptional regulator
MSKTGRRNQVLLKEVAERALVSLGTASRVLNNHPNVQPDLRLRVLAAATELGYPVEKSRANYYTKDRSGPGPGPGIAHFVTETPPNSEQGRELSHVAFCCRPVISPLMDEAYNPYFSSMLHGVEVECRQQNLHLIYRIINDDEAALEDGKQKLREAGAEALLLINFINQELVSGLLDLNLPTVLVDHYFPELSLDMVSHENYNGAHRAVTYLIEKGHRRIGFVHGLPHYTIQRRFEGYRLALEKAGIPFDPNLLVEGNLKVDGGRTAAQEIVDRKLDCTAYFCANDETAIGLIQGLRANGLQVPEDISVMGFDDVDSARLITPALTTIRGNPAGVGRVAVRKLLERVKAPDLPVTQTLLATFLIERDSVRALA